MKLWKLFLVVMLALVIPVAATADSEHPVMPGDTLWDLAGLKLEDNFAWGRIVQANPFLSQPGRIFERGNRTIALIKPGERLIIPNGVNVQPIAVAVSGFTWGSFMDTFPWWLLLLAIAAAVLIVALLTRRRLSNPIASGPPMVPGGIPPNDGRRVADHLREVAYRSHLDLHPEAVGMPLTQFQLAGPITYGRFYGLAEIRYRDGRRENKLFNGESGYQADMQFPGGTTETVYFAEICANDVRRGTRHFPGANFRFEETREIPVPAPVPAPLRAVPAAGPVTMTTLKFEGVEYQVPEGTKFQVDNGTVKITVPAACEIVARKLVRPKPHAARKPAAASSAS